jgi:Flp pilus assembly protein TadG
MTARTTAPRRGRSGAAVVEFAIVAPLLFSLILGIIEFGRAFMIAEVVINASREGARYAVSQNAGDVEDVKRYTREYLNAAGVGDKSKVYPTPDPAIPTLSVGTGTARPPTDLGDGISLVNNSSYPKGTPIQVYVEVDFSKVTWLPSGIFIRSGSKISGATVMRME